MRTTSRKSLSLLLALALIVSLFVGITTTVNAYSDNWTDSGNYDSSFAGGSGTSDSPYQIATGAQLAYLAKQVNDGVTNYQNTYFVLTADIDLANHNWIPIGGMCGEDANYVPNGNSFRGVFNGYYNNSVHKIKNMTISMAASSSTKAGYGLFGYVSGGAIGNVILEGGSVTVTGSGEYVGGLVGYVSGNVYNVTSNVPVTASGSSNVGGIAGAAERRTGGAATVKYVKNTGDVEGLKRVGGVIGGLYSANNNIVTLECAVNTGAVNAAGINQKVYAGGLVGYTRGDILHSYNTGNVSTSDDPTYGSRYVGGITGILNGYNTPYANLKYSYSSATTLTAKSEKMALYASADTSTHPAVTYVFWTDTCNVDQTISPNWGNITAPVAEVDSSELNGSANISGYSNNILYYLNTSASTNDGFEVISDASQPTLKWESVSMFKVETLTSAGAEGGSADTDDPDMIFVDFVNGTDNTVGSKSQPVDTLAHALALFAGDNTRNVIYFLNGMTVSSGTSTHTASSAVTLKRSCEYNGYLFRVSGTGTLKLGTNLTVDGNKDNFTASTSSLIYMSGGMLTITGATLQNNWANTGAAVRVLGGTMNMDAGTIQNNLAVNAGGAIQVSDGRLGSSGVFNMTGGSIKTNTAGTAGGGIVIYGNGQASVAGTENSREGIAHITSNTAGANGGGVAIIKNASTLTPILTISGTFNSIGNNSATNGSGVFVGAGSTFNYGGSGIASGQVVYLANTLGSSDAYITLTSAPAATITVKCAKPSTTLPTRVATYGTDVSSSFAYVSNQYGFLGSYDWSTFMTNIVLTTYTA